LQVTMLPAVTLLGPVLVTTRLASSTGARATSSQLLGWTGSGTVLLTHCRLLVGTPAVAVNTALTVTLSPTPTERPVHWAPPGTAVEPGELAAASNTRFAPGVSPMTASVTGLGPLFSKVRSEEHTSE